MPATGRHLVINCRQFNHLPQDYSIINILLLTSNMLLYTLLAMVEDQPDDDTRCKQFIQMNPLLME